MRAREALACLSRLNGRAGDLHSFQFPASPDRDYLPASGPGVRGYTSCLTDDSLFLIFKPTRDG